MEFLHLGGLLLSKLSGCGKRKMKEAGFPASRVTVCKMERERGWGRERGAGKPYSEGPRETQFEFWLGRVRRTAGVRGSHFRSHQGCGISSRGGRGGSEDAVGLRLVGDG